MKKKVLFIFVLFSFVFFGVTERPQLYANDPIDWEESDIEEKQAIIKKHVDVMVLLFITGKYVVVLDMPKLVRGNVMEKCITVSDLISIPLN